MTRTEELDAMTLDDKKADILKNLARCDFLRLDQKSQLMFWDSAIAELVNEGKITAELREVDEQYSYLRVEFANDG